MTSRTEEMSQTSKRNELTIARVFDAPRESVWKAWTDPERAKRWWGPEGFTAPFIKIDLRVGGKYLFCMRSPDGKDYWSTVFYNDTAPLQRFALSLRFALLL